MPSRVAAVIAVAVGGYLAVASASYWLWVADSAFRGIRAPADYRLGVVSVTIAAAPFVVGAVVVYVLRRRARAVAVACGSCAAAVAAVPAILYATLITVI